MKISTIYKRYKIIPRLADHMYQTAGVAVVICNNYKEKLDNNAIIATCLVHDLGNIVKSDLDKWPPKLTKSKDLTYWKAVQMDFISKYDIDEHKATLLICKELGIDKKIIKLLDGYGSSWGKATLNSDNSELKISTYSDMRVSPVGVVSIGERFDEAIKRYSTHLMKSKRDSVKQLLKLRDIWLMIEKQIFDRRKIGPEEITNEAVQPMLKSLRDFDVKTK